MSRIISCALALAAFVFILVIAVGYADAAQVCSKSGKCVKVAAVAQSKLQCVVDYVESHGVRIAAMRGYGKGTVRGSKHPGGKALDINQYARGKTKPRVSHSVANAAGRTCGVVSGGTWHNDDVGHWNLGGEVRVASAKRRHHPRQRVAAKPRHRQRVAKRQPQRRQRVAQVFPAMY